MKNKQETMECPHCGKAFEVAPEPRVKSTVLSDAWNEIVKPPIPRCREVSAGRATKIKTRLRERNLEQWREVFRRIAASSFCNGANDQNWVATFDWIIGSSEPSIRVLEGKYDDRRRQAPKPMDAAPLRPRNCRHNPPCKSDAAHTDRYLIEQQAGVIRGTV